jgi:hypothetical protein
VSDVHGLPGPLPAGERLLWQGKPNWRILARTALHVRKIALYFAILLVWYVVAKLSDAEPVRSVAVVTAQLAGLALVPVALLTLYAWLTSHATVYTVTSRRVVIRCGVAMPMTINIPFRKIESANLRLGADGAGDIALMLAPTERLAYLILWPHARPWRMARAEPMLRAIPDASRVAQTLARALAASASVPVAAVAEPRQTAPAAHAGRAAAAA